MNADEQLRKSLHWGEIDGLLQRLEDQFATQQILQRRYLSLVGEQEQKLDPITLSEPLPPLKAAKPSKEFVDHPAIDSNTSLDETWWPTGLAEPDPMVPQTGWRSISMRFAHAKGLGISICGMSADKSQHLVEMIARRQELERDFRPVFLTDSLDFSMFLPFGFVVEYLPPKPRREHTRHQSAWKAYVSARRDFIVRKWNLQEIIQFGPKPFGE